MASSTYSLPTVVLSTKEHLTLYRRGKDLTDDDARSLCAYLISGLQSPPSELLLVAEYVVGILTLALPELGPEMANMTSLRLAVVDVTKGMVEQIAGGGPSGLPPLDRLIRELKPLDTSFAVDSTIGVYAGVASIVMSIGKQGGSGPEAAAVKSRPKALVNRFGIPEDQQLLLPGQPCGPTLMGLDRVYTAFSTYTEPRAILVRFLLGVEQSAGHLPVNYEIVMTNFRLMRGAGMTHVEAINKLMHMHPWTLRVPELAPYYARYANELEEFNKIPKPVRMYHRLLVPQSEFLFLTPDYKPLIAVAGSYVKEVENSFSGYVYGESEYATLIHTVKSYQPGTAAYIGSGTLAQRLGVQDMTLPTKSTQSKSPMVSAV